MLLTVINTLASLTIVSNSYSKIYNAKCQFHQGKKISGWNNCNTLHLHKLFNIPQITSKVESRILIFSFLKKRNKIYHNREALRSTEKNLPQTVCRSCQCPQCRHDTRLKRGVINFRTLSSPHRLVHLLS